MPRDLPSLKIVSLMRGIFALAEYLVAPFTGVAGCAKSAPAARQSGRHVMEVFEVPNSRHVLDRNSTAIGPCSDRSADSSSTMSAALRPNDVAAQSFMAAAAWTTIHELGPVRYKCSPR